MVFAVSVCKPHPPTLKAKVACTTTNLWHCLSGSHVSVPCESIPTLSSRGLHNAEFDNTMFRSVARSQLFFEIRTVNFLARSFDEELVLCDHFFVKILFKIKPHSCTIVCWDRIRDHSGIGLFCAIPFLHVIMIVFVCVLEFHTFKCDPGLIKI